MKTNVLVTNAFNNSMNQLTDELDFGNLWYGIPCCQTYWDTVEPIFDRLKEGKEKGERWSDFPNKEKTVYMPLLKAFMEEIKRAYTSDEELPRKLLEYIIGMEDSYKTVGHDNKRVTLIYKFNEREKAGIVEYMPTEIVAIKMKKDSENTAEIYLNNGWQLSFRIYNANSMVEPSLKFAIKFEGMPPSVLHLECRWS